MSSTGPHALRLVPREGRPSASFPAPKLDDHALVAAARNGDPGVASLFCDRLWPQVDRSIRRLVGAHDVDRDDLAQLAMMELVNTIERYRADCSLDSWAQTITAHVVYKHLRRRRLERRLFCHLLADDGLIGSPVHEERRSASREALARVAQHLDGMDERKAWAYVLHDLLGYDLREISQITGASPAATQSRLVRGRREVHERIENDPDLAQALIDPEVWR
jgi:RNA polymerase sigma factor (sigma-70 family)